MYVASYFSVTYRAYKLFWLSATDSYRLLFINLQFPILGALINTKDSARLVRRFLLT